MKTSEEAEWLEDFAFQTSQFSRVGVTAERAFVTERLARVNAAFRWPAMAGTTRAGLVKRPKICKAVLAIRRTQVENRRQ